LLVRALAHRSGPGDALDLGYGAGNDTRYLLDLGYRVVAVDANPTAIAVLPDHPRLEAIQATFAEFSQRPGAYDLISAQLALPFNPPDTFADVFARLVTMLRPGGIFTGNLFGTRDAWNVPTSEMTFHTRLEVEALLQGLEPIEITEMEGPVNLADGTIHAAHAFDIIARKPPGTAN
jgi:SAM-dependent methyltransferase